MKTVRIWSRGLARAAVVAAAASLLPPLGCSSHDSSPVESTVGALSPSTGWSGCSGTFDTVPSPTGAYFVTDFGCSSAPEFTDTGDNCCPSGVVQAATAGICEPGVTTAGCTSDVGTTSAIACERSVNWFSTGGTAFGLGTRLRLTRPDTGTSVVVFVIDNGPACFREQQFGGFALDISYPAIMTLYGEEEGVSDRAIVVATVVASSTPLGPTSAHGGVDAGVDAYTHVPPTHDAGHAISMADAGDAGKKAIDAKGTVDVAATDASSSGEEAGVDAGDAADGDAAESGMPCADDGDCNPGSDGSGQYCDEGTCVVGCDADWECPGTTSCVSGTCQ